MPGSDLYFKRPSFKPTAFDNVMLQRFGRKRGASLVYGVLSNFKGECRPAERATSLLLQLLIVIFDP